MNKAKRPTYIRICTLLVLAFAFGSVRAQLYSESFGTAGTCSDITTGGNIIVGLDTWEVLLDGTNTPDTANRWFVSAREANMGQGNCGDGCLTTSANDQKTLHIGTKIPYDAGAVYDNDSAAKVLVYSPAIDFLSINNDMSIEFDYQHGGDSNDYCELIIDVGAGAPDLFPAYSIELPRTTSTSCGSAGEWMHYTYYCPANLNTIPEVYIGFRWRNDANGSGGPLSCAVDNIVVDNTLPLPIIQTSVDSICDGGTITFSDSSQGNVTNWSWQFGSTASPSTATNTNGAPVNVTFPTPGVYTVTLTVTNGNGTASTTYDITAVSCVAPVAAGISTDSSLCQGQVINFFDISTPGTFGGAAMQYTWQFQGGNPSVSFDQHPAGILYTTAGIYNVTLTVTDTVSGLSNTGIFNGMIIVGNCAVPVAAYLPDTSVFCNNDCIEFYDISTGNPDSILWEFEGGNPNIISGTADSLDTITVCYPVPGDYYVRMLVWNGAGSHDTVDSFRVTVLNCPVPVPGFNVSSRFICPGEAIVFEDTSDYATAWSWQFPGAQPSSSTDKNPVNIQYNTPGSYNVTLTVFNVNGDSTLIQEAFIVVDSCLPPDPRFTIESDTICEGTCVQFFHTSLRTDSFYWVFWGHPMPDTTDTIFAVVTLDGVESIDTFVMATDYWPLYMNNADSTIDTLFMEPEPILCFNDSITIGVQLFAFNQYDVSIENQQDVAVLSVGGTYPKITPGPHKYIQIDNIESRFYLEDTTNFETSGTGPFWRWFPEDGLSCVDCPNPIVYPTYSRQYYVTNFDEFGCADYDSVWVYVEESYFAGIPNIFSPNGDNNNDVLWVRGNAISSDGFVLRIWNRFGDLVFESYSQNDGWDGTINGVEAPIGSYKYYVKFAFETGNQHELSGNVTLVRY